MGKNISQNSVISAKLHLKEADNCKTLNPGNEQPAGHLIRPQHNILYTSLLITYTTNFAGLITVLLELYR